MIAKEITEVAKGNTLQRPGICWIYQLAHNKEIDKVLIYSDYRLVQVENVLLKSILKFKDYGVIVGTKKEGQFDISLFDPSNIQVLDISK